MLYKQYRSPLDGACCTVPGFTGADSASCCGFGRHAFLPAVVAGAVLEPTTLGLMLSAATIAVRVGPSRRAVTGLFGAVECPAPAEILCRR